MRQTFIVAFAGLALAAAAPLSVAMAMGGGSDAPAAKAAPAVPADPNFALGKAAIDAKEWAKAIGLFNVVVAKDPQNADAFNYLGFAYRNQGNYDEAFKQYNVALTINPRHRGAHEYVGEAYLKVGDIKKAEEHLARLDSICTFGCAEYTELKTKIAAAKGAKSS